jgi:lysophospholipase L1-like esterase
VTELRQAPRRRVLVWIGGGVVAGLILGLSASLLVRPPIEDDGRLILLAQSGETVKVAFVGDTLKQGYFATDEQEGYRAIVLDELQAPTEEVPVTDFGARVIPELPTSIVPGSADLVIVEMGTHNVFVTPPDEFEAEYAALIDNVLLSAPNAAIVCLGVWGNADAAREYDAPIGKACRNAGGAFVPLFDAFNKEGNRGPEGRETFLGPADSFHPNDDGHREIANRILERLKLS